MESEEAPSPRAIFDHVVAVASADERLTYLNGACADRPELRKRVQALLDAHAAAGNFLEMPAVTAELKPTADIQNSAVPTEKAGAVIGQFKLLEPIGEGGMGVVFMAEQAQPVRRRVALKLIKPGMDSRQVIARFEAERQALAMMDHPNIAKVFEAGATDAGRPYFVMELVRGIPITDYCDQAHLDARNRLRLFMQVCHAVQHAHQKGIIHRDLKPNNVLVTLHDGSPVPKVIDFGIAKATAGQRLTDNTLFTEFRQLIGTPLYMSPEQAEMSALDVDTRSDVYSLGVLFYELLTGTTPFDKQRLGKAAHDEVRRIIREEEPFRPSTRVSMLGATGTAVSTQRGTDPKRLSQLLRGELDWIVMRALEKDRTRRYETAGGLARDVERYLANEPVDACPPSQTYRLRKFVRRNRARVITATSFITLLIAATVASGWQAIRATRAKAIAINAEHEVSLERDEVVQQKQIAQRNFMKASAAEGQARKAEAQSRSGLVANLVERGINYQQSGDPSLALLWYIRALRLQPDDIKLTLNDRIRIRAAFDEAERPVVGIRASGDDLDSSRSGGPTKTSDGRYLEFGTNPPVTIVHARNKAPGTLQMEANTRPPVQAAFSADGGRIVTGDWYGHVRVWNAFTGRAASPPMKQDYNVDSVEFSPDDTKILTGGWGRTAFIWDSVSGARLASVGSHRAWIADARFSPDGTRVVTASYDSSAQISNAVTGLVIGPPFKHDAAVMRATFTPDGAHVETATSKHDVRFWDAQNGPTANPIIMHGSKVRVASFSSDGLRIVTASNDKTARIWDAASGQPLTPPLQHLDKVIHAAFSPDGTRVVTTSDDQTAMVWDAASGKPLSPAMRHRAEVSYAEFSPDGTRILTASDDTTARVWDAMSGQPMTPPMRHEGHLGRAVFNFDGTRILTCAGDSAHVWDAKTGQPLIPPLQCQGVRCAAFSPDGTRVVTAGRTGAQIWDAVTGKSVAPELHHDSAVNYAVFSPDGSRIVTASQDRTACVWDAVTGKLVLPPLQHIRYVYSASFSRDGKRIATASWDYSARVWDASNGRPLTPPLKHDSLVYTAVFSPDGNRLLTASYDWTVRCWDVGPTERPVSDLEARAELLCVRKVDELAGTWPLNREEFQARWEMLTEKYPQDFFPAPSSHFASEAIGDSRYSPVLLAELGMWFAKRREFAGAALLLDTARRRGAVVDTAALARCYWCADNLASAAIEFRRAINERSAITDARERQQLERCVTAVTSDWMQAEIAARKRSAATHPATRPFFDQ